MVLHAVAAASPYVDCRRRPVSREQMNEESERREGGMDKIRLEGNGHTNSWGLGGGVV